MSHRRDTKSAKVLMKNHNFELSSLPFDLYDGWWLSFQGACGLSDAQLLALQYAVIQQKERSERGSAKAALNLLRLNNVREDGFPLNYCDLKWLHIQRECNIKPLDWAMFRYYAAVVRAEKLLRLDAKEESAQEYMETIRAVEYVREVSNPLCERRSMV